MIRDALTELYSNLSYITLSGARDFYFHAVSDFTAKISNLLKEATRLNIQEQVESHYQNDFNINQDRLFVSKIKDTLDTVIDISKDILKGINK